MKLIKTFSKTALFVSVSIGLMGIDIGTAQANHGIMHTIKHKKSPAPPSIRPPVNIPAPPSIRPPVNIPAPPSISFPVNIPVSNPVNTIKKTAGTASADATNSVTGATSAVLDNKSSSQGLNEKTAHSVGTVIFDPSTRLGNLVTISGQPVTQLMQNNAVIGYVKVQDNTLVSEVNVLGGKIVSTTPETGAKLTINGQNITGREVLANGKIIGHEIIKEGKIVGHSAIAGGEYVVNAAGNIMLSAFSSARCESFVSGIMAGEKAIATTIIPGMSELQNLQDVAQAANDKGKQVSASDKQNIQKEANSWLLKQSPMIPGMLTEVAIIKQKISQVRALFKPSTFCNLTAAQVTQKLNALNLKAILPLKTTSLFDKGFFIKGVAAADGSDPFISLNLSLDANVILGGTVTLSLVSGFQSDQGGTYIGIGPSFTANAQAEGAISTSHYPSVPESSFVGWGKSVTASVGGEGESIDATGAIEMDMGDANFQGFTVGVGAGVDAAPADFGMEFMYTWRASKI